jgi:hypothetical protein
MVTLKVKEMDSEHLDGTGGSRRGSAFVFSILASMKLTEAQMKMASGAFFMESDDERERERERVARRRAPPTSSRQTKASRISQQHQH